VPQGGLRFILIEHLEAIGLGVGDPLLDGRLHLGPVAGRVGADVGALGVWVLVTSVAGAFGTINAGARIVNNATGGIVKNRRIFLIERGLLQFDGEVAARRDSSTSPLPISLSGIQSSVDHRGLTDG
jgi:hypothetical protein